MIGAPPEEDRQAGGHVYPTAEAANGQTLMTGSNGWQVGALVLTAVPGGGNGFAITEIEYDPDADPEQNRAGKYLAPVLLRCQTLEMLS